MKKFEQFKLQDLEDVGVNKESDKDVFTGYAFYDAKLGIVSFGVDRYSGYNALALGVPEHVFLDFDCTVEFKTACSAIWDFAIRTSIARSFYEKEMARVRMEMMLKGYIKPMSSNTEKESSAI